MLILIKNGLRIIMYGLHESTYLPSIIIHGLTSKYSYVYYFKYSLN